MWLKPKPPSLVEPTRYNPNKVKIPYQAQRSINSMKLAIQNVLLNEVTVFTKLALLFSSMVNFSIYVFLKCFGFTNKTNK